MKGTPRYAITLWRRKRGKNKCLTHAARVLGGQLVPVPPIPSAVSNFEAHRTAAFVTEHYPRDNIYWTVYNLRFIRYYELFFQYRKQTKLLSVMALRRHLGCDIIIGEATWRIVSDEGKEK